MPKVIGIGPHFHSSLKEKGLSSDFIPHVFLKTMRGVIGNNEPINLPEGAQKVLAEVEVALKLNRTLKNVSKQEVQDLTCVEGYAISGDLTALGETISGEGKIYDTFTPCGDFQKNIDIKSLNIQSFLNGVLMQKSVVIQDMTYDFATVISFFSKILTLEAGDILLTGTPAGAFAIKKGDVLKFYSPQLGEVINTVN